MEESPIGRKRLDHRIPHHAQRTSTKDLFFLTICCSPRGRNQLAKKPVWTAILETFEHRKSLNLMEAKLILAMPDHLHALVLLTGNRPLDRVVTDLKSWLAKSCQIRWQRDFFDHRVRTWESSNEKADYIRQNPYRANLIESSEAWPFLYDQMQ